MIVVYGSPGWGTGAVLGNEIATVWVQGVPYVMDLRDGLDPESTDWSVVPPRPIFKRRAKVWDKGAYVVSPN